MPRRLAILLVPLLLAATAHAQDRQGNPPAQSQALTDAENALMAKVAEGDKAYDAAADAIDAGKDAAAICPSLADALTAYEASLPMMEQVKTMIAAEPGMVDTMRASETGAVDDLKTDIDASLGEVEGAQVTHDCPE